MNEKNRLISLSSNRWFLTIAALIVLAIFVIYFCIRVALSQIDGPRGDWGVFYKAGLALRENTPLYNLDDGPLATFKYAPVVAICMIWMSYFPMMISRIIWLLGDVVMFWLVMVMTYKLSGIKVIKPYDLWAPVSLTVLSLIGYLIDHLQGGQVTCAVLLLTTGCFYLLWHDKPIEAGAILALAFCIKVVPLSFLPLFFMKRKWLPGIGSFVLTVLALLLAPAFWIGWSTNWELIAQWPQHLANTNIPVQIYRPQNLSFYAILARTYGGYGWGNGLFSLPLEYITWLWLFLTAISATMVYSWIWKSLLRSKNQMAPVICLSMVTIFMTLFNPHGWRYNFIALVIPVFVLMMSFWSHPEGLRPRLCLVTVGILLQYISTRQSDLTVILILRDYGGRAFGVILILIALFLLHQSEKKYVNI